MGLQWLLWCLIFCLCSCLVHANHLWEFWFKVADFAPFVILRLYDAEVNCHHIDLKTSLYLVICLNMPPKCCGFTNNLLCFLLLPKLMKYSQSCHHQGIKFTHLQHLQFQYFFPEIISACSKNSSMSWFQSFTERTGFSSSSSGDSDGKANLWHFNGPGAVSSISNQMHKETDKHYLWWSQRMMCWWSQFHQDLSHCSCHCCCHLHLWLTCWNACTKNLVSWLKAQKAQQRRYSNRNRRVYFSLHSLQVLCLCPCFSMGSQHRLSIIGNVLNFAGWNMHLLGLLGDCIVQMWHGKAK